MIAITPVSGLLFIPIDANIKAISVSTLKNPNTNQNLLANKFTSGKKTGNAIAMPARIAVYKM